ncbi:MAG: peptidylprolyl isomerase [Candidatus Krumholzibacteria bacterium]|nr:peptidylprolyl isomerase [Candidatus Krumholzibacteria bacterium]MDH5271325.1 peptidylprolyl isomerase [Candidatus Krumholzibacteria bacterium]
MKKLLRDPLLQFLLLGAALFVAFHITRGRTGEQPARIVVTPGQVETLVAGFERTWQRLPTTEELNGLVEDHIREEIAVREATALGLDRDDAIIRRRLRMKLDLMTEDVASQVDPTDDQLQEFMQQHSATYVEDPAVAFQQVFFNPDKRGDAAADAQAALARLRSAERRIDLDTLGDPSLLPQEVGLAAQRDVASQFGEEFANAVVAASPGEWSGPVRSSFGWHVVFVSESRPGRMPELSEVRDAVARDWFVMRRKELQEAFYRKLRERYEVVIEPPRETTGNGAQAARVSP